MWGDPITVSRGPDQEPLNLLLFDTEGFEATGKADAYDDRIFALSTIVSAVLIYNLPETVRESDLQVTSFFHCFIIPRRLCLVCCFKDILSMTGPVVQAFSALQVSASGLSKQG